MQPQLIRCMECRHFDDGGIELIDHGEGVVDPEDMFKFTCPAFSEGIPLRIRSWEEPHHSVRENQFGDYVFKPKGGPNLGIKTFSSKPFEPEELEAE